MATWKKVIVSGSAANLANLQVDALSSGLVTGNSGNLTTTAVNGSGNIVATTGATGLKHSGSFSGSYEGDGSNLTGIAATTLDIDAFGNDLSSATLAAGDKIIVSDNGTEGRATVSQLATPLGGNGLSGSGELNVQASGSSLTVNSNGVGIAAGGVLNSHLGSDSVNGAKIADDSIDSEHIADGAIDTAHIADDQVTADKLANTAVTAGTYGTTTAIPRFIVDAQGRITSASTVAISTSFSIDADSGTANDIDGGETFTISGDNTISTAVSANTITISATDGIISASVLSSPSQGTVRLVSNGNTTNVDTGLQTGDSPTFAALTVTGDLTVQGTTTSLQTTNLNVEDQFILLHSGSGTGDQGLVFSSGSSGNSGAAFFYDVAKDRLAYATGSVSWNSTAVVPNAYVALVVDTEDSHDGDGAKVAKRGNIQVDASNPYIYV